MLGQTKEETIGEKKATGVPGIQGDRDMDKLTNDGKLKAVTAAAEATNRAVMLIFLFPLCRPLNPLSVYVL